MKSICLAALMVSLGVLGAVAKTTNTTASPAAPANTTDMPPSDVAAAHKALLFRPPGVTGGVLPIRVGGGSRGAVGDDISVEVLVPDQIALTTQAQPSLYWYQSKAAKTRC